MELELSHRQGLTLAMQTSMRLLQLNNLQLRNYLGELMTTNAVVELEFPEIEYRPSPFDRRGSSTAPSGNTAVSKEQLMEDKAAGISVLHDLFLQSVALKLPQPLQRIMQYLIHSLDTNVFFDRIRRSDSRYARCLPGRCAEMHRLAAGHGTCRCRRC